MFVLVWCILWLVYFLNSTAFALQICYKAKAGSLEKSMVVNDETGEGEASDVRTSSGMFLDTAHVWFID